MRPTYLDNNATTRVDPAVIEAMLPYFTEHFGNASSLHGFGGVVAKALRKARVAVQRLIGAAHEDEVVFTSGGSEADNTAIGVALDLPGGRDEIVTSQVEHPAVLAVCKHLAHTRRATVRYVAVDGRGRLDLDAYRAALGPRTALVSLMWANNETGTIFPVATLAELAHGVGALFHTDAIQAVGKVSVDVGATMVDLLSLSGHKLHGPKGIGALYVRRGVPLRPLIRGGRQERARRAGTENSPGIVGLGKAAELAVAHLSGEGTRVRALRDRLEHGIVNAIGNVLPLGDAEARLPNTSALAFDGAEAEAILTHLDRVGIAASSGSACASGSLEPSHVLRAMKVPYPHIHGAIRFSLSRNSRDADVDHVLGTLPRIIANLRTSSPSAPGPRIPWPRTELFAITPF